MISRLFPALLLFIASLPLGAQPADPNSPEAELAALHVLDGYEIHLFASEADGIAKPLQMRFDERGRLWVACTTAYPQVEPGKKPNDKIVILEDTTGSGRADKATVFADGLTIPTGLELTPNGAFVATGTELLFLGDPNHTGHATSRDVVFSGFGTGDAHQMINSFQWGPEGALWIGQGAHTFSNVETPWGTERLYSAGVWRFRPRTLKMDPFLDSRRGHSTNNWAGPANPWGFAFDDWGQVFCNDAAGHRGLTWITPALIRSDRDVAIPTLWRIPKGCGIDIVGSTALPDDLQGRLILGHYFTATVRQFQIRDDASGFALTEMPMLVKSDTNAFRIVDIKVGPDGAIYLCDWYNPVIGHYQASYRDPNRDKTHGRIWRLTAKGRAPTHPPDLASMSATQLLAQLPSTDHWTVYQARRLLYNLPSDQVVPAVDAWVKTFDPASPQYEHDLYLATGIYESHEAVRPELLKKLATAKDYRARAYAARVIGHWADRLDKPLDLLRTLVQDENPRVRVEAIVASTFVNDSHAIEVAAMAADRPLDVWINHAMLRAVDATKDQWRPAFARGELTFDHNVNRLSWVLKADGTAAVAGPLRQMLSGDKVDSKTRSDLAALLANVGESGDLQFLLTHYAQDPAVLRELAAAWRLRQVRPDADVSAPVLSAIKSANPEVRAKALRLAGAWSVTAAVEPLRATAADAGQPIDVRTAAIAALGEMKLATSENVAPLLAKDQPLDVRRAAIDALASSNPTAAASAAAGVLPELKTDAEIADLLAVFTQRKGATAALAGKLKTAKLSPQLAQRCLDVLHARGRDDPALSKTLNAILGVSDDTPPYSEKLVNDLAAAMKSSGDPTRGKALYNAKLATACAACHSIDGKGGNLGPDLSNIGRGLTPEFIIESVLWPKRVVKEGYLSVSIATKDGGDFSGYVTSENATEIQLRDVATNTVQRIPKASITKRQDAGTIMPDGLTASLSPDEVRDLFAYLTHLGK